MQERERKEREERDQKEQREIQWREMEHRQQEALTQREEEQKANQESIKTKVGVHQNRNQKSYNLGHSSCKFEKECRIHH